jgi:hypothetical protein
MQKAPTTSLQHVHKQSPLLGQYLGDTLMRLLDLSLIRLSPLQFPMGVRRPSSFTLSEMQPTPGTCRDAEHTREPPP